MEQNAMSLRVSLAVLAVALASVVFGLDWQSASIAPPPRFVSTAPLAVPPAPAPAKTDAVPAESSNAPVLPDGANGARAPLAQAPPPNCNVDACEAAYRSFRASDCTYQPTRGERRLCTKK